MTGAEVVTLGETLGLLTPPGDDRVQYADALLLRTGGAESNTAIGLARLGVRARWIGRVGDDPVGRRVVRDLRGEGVDVVAVVDETAPTALMIKERRPGGVQEVWYHRALSAGSRLTPDDVPADLVDGAAVLHLTGITLGLSDSAAAAVAHAIGLARSAGAAVSFDVNHRARVWGARSPARAYAGAIAAADVVFGGPEEFAHVLGGESTALDTARRMRDLGVAEVVVKDGDRGAVCAGPGFEEAAPAEEIDALDAVGAGDAFVAAYLEGRLRGREPADRLRRACRAGALACLQRGDWEGGPTRRELAAPAPAQLR